MSQLTKTLNADTMNMVDQDGQPSCIMPESLDRSVAPTAEAEPSPTSAPAAPPSRYCPCDHPDWLNFNIVPVGGSAMAAAADELRRQLALYEDASRTRLRKRRGGHRGPQESYDRMVDVIVANAALAVLGGSYGLPIGVRGLNEKEADPHWAFGKQWPALRDALVQGGWIMWQDGHIPNQGRRGTAPAFDPTEAFVDLIGQHGANISDVMTDPEAEVIELAVSEWNRGTKKRTTMDLSDTAEVQAMRSQVRAINDRLRQADLRWNRIGDAQGAIALLPHRRGMVRKFIHRPGDTISFDKGGRLYGGAWQAMSKLERRHLLIDGEPAVELDYSGMAPRLAYAEAKAELEGDPYLVPGLNGYREDVKALFNALLSVAKGFQTDALWWPKTIKEAMDKAATGSADHNGQFPLGSLPHVRGMTGRQAWQMIAEHHAPIRTLFRSDAGVRLQFTESQIMMGVLETAAMRGFTALPVFDALLVPASKVSLAKEIMEATAMIVGRVRIPVKVVTLNRDC
jgi:hypothetical protein